MVITDTTMMRLLLALALVCLAQALAGCDGARRSTPGFGAQGSIGGAASLPGVGSTPRSLGTTGGAAFAAGAATAATLGSGGATPTVGVR